MKLVLVDNFARETVADVLLQDNVHADCAERMADNWNEHHGGAHAFRYCVVKPDDYVLWRGMEDLV